MCVCVCVCYRATEENICINSKPTFQTTPSKLSPPISIFLSSLQHFVSPLSSLVVCSNVYTPFLYSPSFPLFPLRLAVLLCIDVIKPPAYSSVTSLIFTLHIFGPLISLVLHRVMYKVAKKVSKTHNDR